MCITFTVTCMRCKISWLWFHSRKWGETSLKSVTWSHCVSVHNIHIQLSFFPEFLQELVSPEIPQEDLPRQKALWELFIQEVLLLQTLLLLSDQLFQSLPLPLNPSCQQPSHKWITAHGIPLSKQSSSLVAQYKWVCMCPDIPFSRSDTTSLMHKPLESFLLVFTGNLLLYLKLSM